VAVSGGLIESVTFGDALPPGIPALPSDAILAPGFQFEESRRGICDIRRWIGRASGMELVTGDTNIVNAAQCRRQQPDRRKLFERLQRLADRQQVRPETVAARQADGCDGPAGCDRSMAIDLDAGSGRSSPIPAQCCSTTGRRSGSSRSRSASARTLSPSLFSDPVMPMPVAHENPHLAVAHQRCQRAPDRDQLAARGLTAMDTPRQRRRIEPAADPASARCRAALVLRQDGK
jgi:hypothetical protein